MLRPHLVFLIRDLPHLTQSQPRLREVILKLQNLNLMHNTCQ